ncbi:MAG: M23 family metallopeptidase [Bacteroidota bacterium]|jgi:murein DD-endopeptidase MepM/ murein hydrolase activator NlpD
MKWFKWDFVRKTTFYITPNYPDASTKNYKFSLFRIAAYTLIYTFISWLVLIFILSVSPLKDFLFVLDNQEFIEQRSKINELQTKVELLTGQLQKIASTNERMKYALKLANTDSISSSNPLYDTLKKTINKKLPVGGNIYSVFKELLNIIYQSNSKSIFLEPVTGIITQRFNSEKGHLGIDYGVPSGTPVYASAGGMVIFADYTYENGYMIIINHDNGYTTLYKHCSSVLKKQRDYVRQGELIALSGNSGKNTTGPHLHFEIWLNGKPINPEEILIK